MLTETQDTVSIRDAIVAQVIDVAAQQRKQLAPLSDGLRLLDSGLDFLCIAILVASLDDQLDLDPFFGRDDVAFPVTLGEFIALYENAAG